MEQGKLPFKRSFVYREHLTLRVDAKTKEMEKKLKLHQIDTGEILRNAIRNCLREALVELGEEVAA